LAHRPSREKRKNATPATAHGVIRERALLGGASHPIYHEVGCPTALAQAFLAQLTSHRKRAVVLSNGRLKPEVETGSSVFFLTIMIVNFPLIKRGNGNDLTISVT
jgi:hypothetical protein